MVEPKLISYGGHLYNYANSIKSEALNKGIDFKILVSSECEKEIINSLDAIVIFDKNPTITKYKNIISRFFIVPFITNKFMYNGLINNNLKFLNSKWILFFGTANYIDFFALSLWLLFKKDPPKLVLTLRISFFNYKLNRWSIMIFWYILGLFILKFINNFKKNIFFITDSKNLQEEHSRFINQKIFLLPIPHTRSNLDLKLNNFNTINIVALGPARIQKGFVLIYNLIFKFLSDNKISDLIFTIQCSNPSPEIMPIIQSLKKLKSKNLILIEDNLSEEDYFKAIEESDIVLLPYESNSYYAQTSGIFTESLSAGKIIITTNNTWMSSQLLDYGSGLVFENNNFDDFYNKFKYAINNKNVLIENSIATSVKWNKYHNSNNFFHKLLLLIN